MQVLINLDVDDIERAAAFYADALGLVPTRRLFDGTVLELSGASCRLFLLHRPAGSISAADCSMQRDYRPHWTPLHLDFVVDDIDAAVARACAAGATQVAAIERLEWGELVMLRDPFGHGFCLLRFARGDY